MTGKQTLVMATAAVLLAAGRADAALVVELQQSVTAPQGATGAAFDVFVRGSGAAETIDGFLLTLNLTPDPVNPAATGVTFEGAPGGVTEPGTYVFAGQVGEIGPTPTTLAGTTLTFTGFTPSSTLINPGDLFGLGTVLFDVDALVPVGTVFDVAVDLANSNFFGPPFSTVTIPVSAGPLDDTTITVTAAAVPEPSSMTLLAACGLLGGGAAWRRRRTARRVAADATQAA